jgi:hypothetical protein
VTDAEGLNIGGGPAGTNFYQMGFKSNGGWAGTVDWAIDNLRITGAVTPTTSETLFSWETPDNPATPAVDERFEGWIPGNFVDHPPHGHSITSTGATDGTNALQIDRTADQDGFSWGSLFVLNSDTNPDPDVETRRDVPISGPIPAGGPDVYHPRPAFFRRDGQVLSSGRG